MTAYQKWACYPKTYYALNRTMSRSLAIDIPSNFIQLSRNLHETYTHHYSEAFHLLYFLRD